MALAPNLAADRETDRSDRETGRSDRQRDRQRDRQVLTFVLSAVQLQHELVDLLLLDNAELLERQTDTETDRQADVRRVHCSKLNHIDFVIDFN